MQKANQSGRSMVEMLGVLSVIGILSITAVYGYHQAMNSHYASQTVDRIMKRAVVVSGQKLLGQTGDISGFNDDGAYIIPNQIDNSMAGKFGLSANAIPQPVCTKVKNYDWKLPVIMPGECTETNNMKFIFNDNLTENTDAYNEPEEVCPEEHKCGEACCSEGFQCQSGKCRTYCSDIGAYCASCVTGGGYDCLTPTTSSVSGYGYTCFNDNSETLPIFNATQNGCQAFCSATYSNWDGEKNYIPAFDNESSYCCDDQAFPIGADYISEACCNALNSTPSWSPSPYVYISYANGWSTYSSGTESGSACCGYGKYASISSHSGFGFLAKECAAANGGNKEDYCNDCSTSGQALPSNLYQSECVTPCTEWGLWSN